MTNIFKTITVVACMASTIGVFAQSTNSNNQMQTARLTRPIFTGGGSTTNRLAATFAEPFAGNTGGSGGTLQIGAQPGTNFAAAFVASSDGSFGTVTNPTGSGYTYQWVECTGTSGPYTPVVGATSQTFYPISNNFYAVVVSQGGLSVTSNCAYIGTVSINKTSAINSSFSVSPNPTIQNIIITSNEPLQNATVKLFDVSGAMVGTEINLSNKQLTLDIADLAAGIYFVEFTNNAKTERVKVIKQ